MRHYRGGEKGSPLLWQQELFHSETTGVLFLVVSIFGDDKT
jgi:hypothetical protein